MEIIFKAVFKLKALCIILNSLYHIARPFITFHFFPRLRDICEAEGVEVGDGEVLHQAVDTCEGDLRRALTAMQCCQRLIGKITAEGLVEVIWFECYVSKIFI